MKPIGTTSRFLLATARLTISLAITFFVAASLSCDRAPAALKPPITIRFWNGFTGPDGRTMLRLVKQFNDANPDIHVVMQRMEWGTYYNKLFVAGLGGRAPEVFVVHTDSLKRFVGAGLVRRVDDVAGMAGIDLNDFDANVLAAATHGGVLRGLPLDVHPLGMYFNRKLFIEAGIVDEHGAAKPPTNRAEFIDALRRLKKDANNDGNAEQWGFVFTWLRTNCYTLIRQNGGDLFADGGWRTTIDDPKTIEAVAFASDLIREMKLAPGPENFDAFVGFRQGRVAIVFEGIYMLSELQRQTDLDFGAAPVPTLFGTPAAWANSHNICLRSDLNSEELAASGRLLKFLSDNSLDWAAGGQVPVRRSLRDSVAFKTEKRFEAQREFAKQIGYVAYMPSVPFVFEYITEFDVAVEKALRGSESPAAALKSAAVRIKQVIDRYKQSGEWDDATTENRPKEISHDTSRDCEGAVASSVDAPLPYGRGSFDARGNSIARRGDR